MREQTLKTEHTGKLPHFHHLGATFFITTHLHDSIPFDVLKKLKAERNEKIKQVKAQHLIDLQKEIYLIRRAYFYRYDELLDACQNSPSFLNQPEIATIVETKIRKYDGQYYNLIAFTLMPNHIHLILDFSIQLPTTKIWNVDEYVNLSKVMNLIKGGSAYEANKLLKRKEPFWQNGYYDRYIRNHYHYVGAVNYTINNVVKAGLYKYWIEHEFTWVCQNFQQRKLIYPTLW